MLRDSVVRPLALIVSFACTKCHSDLKLLWLSNNMHRRSSVIVHVVGVETGKGSARKDMRRRYSDQLVML